MRGYVARIRQVARAVYRELRAENVTFMAGSIAYHAFVSVLPFLALVLVVVAAFGGEQRATAIVRFTEAYLTPSTQNLLTDAAEKAASDAGVSVVGGVALLWGTSKIFRGLTRRSRISTRRRRRTRRSIRPRTPR
ncbi:YhjD/YihY/BrkB family envelope integrity protein [Halospeciosus flavus]|uniref:YhjD/YihY/BrkB family envelope integrity protein n=1 Tax=Halospeciosus flavus TaxID=3032283 RepID=UPI0036188BB8